MGASPASPLSQRQRGHSPSRWHRESFRTRPEARYCRSPGARNGPGAWARTRPHASRVDVKAARDETGGTFRGQRWSLNADRC